MNIAELYFSHKHLMMKYKFFLHRHLVYFYWEVIFSDYHQICINLHLLHYNNSYKHFHRIETLLFFWDRVNYLNLSKLFNLLFNLVQIIMKYLKFSLKKNRVNKVYNKLEMGLKMDKHNQMEWMKTIYYLISIK